MTTTVRQTPLTARLAPGDSAPARSVSMRTRSAPATVVASSTRPVVSMIPVNIELHPAVRPKLGHSPQVTVRDADDPVAEERNSPAETLRRHDQVHRIHQASVE